MASVVGRTLALLRAPGNSVRFALRRRRRDGGDVASLRDEPKADLFAHLPEDAAAAATRRASALLERHDLGALAARSSRLHFLENLGVLELLERTAVSFAVDGAGLRALDVGCGAFQYATALQRFLASRRCGPVDLTGLEIDGLGRYRDGSTRAAHARAHAALAGPGVRFVVGDFTAMPLPTQDVITMLFPFLDSYPLLRWGLPLRVLQPRRLLERAAELLRPGGVLLVVNQTGREFARLQQGMHGLPLWCERSDPWCTDLVPYAERTADRVGSWWRRA